MLLSGGMPFLPNVGEMAGIENPYLAGSFDGAVKGAGLADLTGGDVTTGAIMGGLPGAGEYLGARFMDTSYVPTNTGQQLINESNQMSMLPRSGFSLDNMPQMSSIPSYVPQNSPLAYTQPREEKSSFELPGLNEFFGKLMPSSPEGWGNLAQGLGGVFLGGMQYNRSRKLEKQMGANRGAYESNLRRQLTRRDAESGRRSNYAGRETQLQASLAELDSRNMPALASLQNNQLSGLANMFTSGVRYAGKQGVFGDRYTSDYSPQPVMPPSSYIMGGTGGMPNVYDSSWMNDNSLARRYRLGGGS